MEKRETARQDRCLKFSNKLSEKLSQSELFKKTFLSKMFFWHPLEQRITQPFVSAPHKFSFLSCMILAVRHCRAQFQLPLTITDSLAVWSQALHWREKIPRLCSNLAWGIKKSLHEQKKKCNWSWQRKFFNEDLSTY